MINPVRHPASNRLLLPLLASVFAAAGCDAPQSVDTAELEPVTQPALARLPVEHRAEAERLLRDRPHVEPPIFYIDGKRFAPGSDTGGYSVINPDLIATTELLSGDEAVARVGPDGRNGVIWITTKARAAKP